MDVEHLPEYLFLSLFEVYHELQEKMKNIIYVEG